MFRLSIALLFLIQPLYLLSVETDSLEVHDAIKAHAPTTLEYRIALVKEYKRYLFSEQRERFLEEHDFDKEQFERAIPFYQLNWKTEGTYRLPNSNSILKLPSNYGLVLGEEALEIYRIDEEPIGEDLEAYVCEANTFDDTMLFRYVDDGYVSLHDWEEIDSKILLEGIISNTEKDNEVRRKRGLEEITNIVWLQEPTLNRETKTVYWATNALCGNEPLVNAIALRLGRKGYERISWVTSPSTFVPFGGHLEVMLQAHSFEPGNRYSDYEVGDKIAEYGVAALVAGSVGAKVFKAGGFLLFFKKAWGFLFASMGGVFYKLRKWYKS